MQADKIVLSLCIPTYNRAKVLDGNLRKLHQQMRGKNLPVEILVSDNCSSDETGEVVRRLLGEGMDLRYIRNASNLGMDRNFAQCYRQAQGRYVAVVGDDDYLIDDMLDRLVAHLRLGDYGLVHLKVDSESRRGAEEARDVEAFLRTTSYWLTYITSNVVNRRFIVDYQFEDYFGTYLSILPLYLRAAVQGRTNLIVHERIFANGIATKTNGGYSFFGVFCNTYLELWKSWVKVGAISAATYQAIKRDIYTRHLLPNVYALLIRRERSSYALDGAWLTLLRHYGRHAYFYRGLLRHMAGRAWRALRLVDR